ncbi:2361_t:CDS:2, partial [Ambispora gerdemannii]
MLETRHLTDEDIEDSTDEASSDEFHTETRIIHKKCFDCGKFRTNFAWCQSCETTRFKENYSKWTTGNLQLDLIIQKSQAEANISGDYLEYIHYDQFELVEFHKAGAFSEIYSAIWLEGPKWDWNENTQAWSRGGPIKVALKKLKNSQNLSKQFLENLRKYHHCLQSGSVADTFDISWKDKIDLLWGISAGLENIHRSNLYHGNLHGGNIMIEDESISTDGRIADIGIHGSQSVQTIAGDLRSKIIPIPHIKVLILETRHLTDEDIEDSTNASSDELDEFHTETRIIHKKCFDCGKFRTNFAWCQSCETTWFKENYSKWTTGNLQLDLIIQKSQAEASSVADTFGISKAPDGFFIIVMKFYKNGDLNQYIENVKDISWKDKIDLLWGVTAGLENIHRYNLYHGNLHGGNIMIEDESISTDGRIADIGIHGS